MHAATSGITNVPVLLSIDEAMLGFSGATRRQGVSGARPMRQGVQLPPEVASYNDILGGVDYMTTRSRDASSWSLLALGELSERFVRGG